MKHEWYYAPTGYEIDHYQDRHRCRNCDISTGIASWIWDQECPNTGAPDWVAIDRKEHEEGVKRLMERMKDRLRCDSCGCSWDNDELGQDALWSHCCQPGTFDT